MHHVAKKFTTAGLPCRLFRVTRDPSSSIPRNSGAGKPTASFWAFAGLFSDGLREAHPSALSTTIPIKTPTAQARRAGVRLAGGRMGVPTAPSPLFSGRD